VWNRMGAAWRLSRRPKSLLLNGLAYTRLSKINARESEFAPKRNCVDK